MCGCVHEAHGFAGAHTHVCMCESQRRMSGVVLYHSPLDGLETGLLLQQAPRVRLSLPRPLQSWGSQVRIGMFGYYVADGDSNPNPHACGESTFNHRATLLSPKVYFKLFCVISQNFIGRFHEYVQKHLLCNLHTHCPDNLKMHLQLYDETCSTEIS